MKTSTSVKTLSLEIDYFIYLYGLINCGFINEPFLIFRCSIVTFTCLLSAALEHYQIFFSKIILWSLLAPKSVLIMCSEVRRGLSFAYNCEVQHT